jgi:hypothetical protein
MQDDDAAAGRVAEFLDHWSRFHRGDGTIRGYADGISLESGGDLRAVLGALAAAEKRAEEAEHQSRADLDTAIKYRGQRQNATDVLQRAWDDLNASRLEAEQLRAHVAELEAEREQRGRRVEQLETLVGQILARFDDTGHPGYAAIRTRWIRVETIAMWRKAAKGREAGPEPRGAGIAASAEVPSCACGAPAAWGVGYKGESGTVFQCERCAVEDRRTPFFHRGIEYYVVRACGPTPNNLVCACGAPAGHSKEAGDA